MTRVYLADSLPDERSALRLMLLDLKMEVVGESADWLITLANAPKTRPDILLLEWDLLLINLGVQALAQLRVACPKTTILVVLNNHLDLHWQAALLAGADAFITKGDTPEHVALQLRLAAARVRVK